jgi:hypothetical protein
MTRFRSWLAVLSTVPARTLLLGLLLAVTILPLPAAVEAAPANADETQLVHRAAATRAEFVLTEPASLSREVTTEVSRVPGRVCVDFRDRDGAGYDSVFCYERGPAGWNELYARVTVCVLG